MTQTNVSDVPYLYLPLVDPYLTMVTGPAESSAGDPVLFSIAVRNLFGGLKSVGGDTFTLEYAGPEENGKASLSLSDNNDGSYTIRVTFTKSGLHLIYVKVTVDQIHIGGSPLSIFTSRKKNTCGSSSVLPLFSKP